MLSKNVSIFKAHGEALNQFASKNVKVLVVANPANTNCYVAMHYAPSIPRENFTALVCFALSYILFSVRPAHALSYQTRLDQERLRALICCQLNENLSEKERITNSDVSQCIIWGNHSRTQVPDCSSTIIQTQDPTLAKKPLRAYVHDIKEFQAKAMQTVRERGEKVIAARKLSSAMSAASAIVAHLRDWFQGSREYVSMAICSDGNKYNIPSDLMYSFPVVCKGQWKYQIADDVPISPICEALLHQTAEELLVEKQKALALLSNPAA